MERLAVYPGSFDPITNGHLDIIKRGLRFFDKLIILIAYNPSKSGLFSVEERMELIRQVVGDDPRVRVDSFSGLLVNYVRDSGAPSSCAVCGPCRISSTSSRWPSSTGA